MNDTEIGGNLELVPQRVRLLALVFIAACGCLPLAADSISSFDNAWWNQEFGAAPGGAFSGWFSDPASPWLDPMESPGQPWTSVDNIALMNSWLGLVDAANGDPALLAQLNGLGMTSAGTPVGAETVLSIGNAPEPAATLLFAIGAFFVGVGLFVRRRRIGKPG